MEPFAYRKMNFDEFCAAAISPYQLEALERWENIASTAFEHFEREGNRVISVEEFSTVSAVSFFCNVVYFSIYFIYALVIFKFFEFRN